MTKKTKRKANNSILDKLPLLTDDAISDALNAGKTSRMQGDRVDNVDTTVESLLESTDRKANKKTKNAIATPQLIERLFKVLAAYKATPYLYTMTLPKLALNLSDQTKNSAK